MPVEYAIDLRTTAPYVLVLGLFVLLAGAFLGLLGQETGLLWASVSASAWLFVVYLLVRLVAALEHLAYES